MLKILPFFMKMITGRIHRVVIHTDWLVKEAWGVMEKWFEIDLICYILKYFKKAYQLSSHDNELG